MSTKKTDDDDQKDDDARDDAKGTGDSGKATGGDTPGDSSLESRIRQLVSEAVDGLLGDRDKGRRVDDEEALFQRVKKAQEKIKAEEEREGKIVKIEETLTKVLEKPPARDGIGGKISRFLWGGED